jgi:hypothetical protein
MYNHPINKSSTLPNPPGYIYICWKRNGLRTSQNVKSEVRVMASHLILFHVTNSDIRRLSS